MKIIFSYSLVILMIFTLFCNGASDREIEKKVIVMKGPEGGLGVLVKDADAEVLKDSDLKGGAEIMEVLEDSEAEKIGLKEGDIIFSFAGKSIESSEELKDIISSMEDEGEVDLMVLRDGQKKSFKAKIKPFEEGDFDFGALEGLDFSLECIPDISKFMGRFPKHFCDGKGGYLGVYANNIPEQMLEYFEVKHGVLVEEVLDDSPAKKSGIKAGDVITEIDGKKIEDYPDLIRVLNYYDPESKVKIKISRKGNTKTVDVTLGKKECKHHKVKHKGDVKVPMVHPRIERKRLKRLKRDIEGNKEHKKMFMI